MHSILSKRKKRNYLEGISRDNITLIHELNNLKDKNPYNPPVMVENQGTVLKQQHRPFIIDCPTPNPNGKNSNTSNTGHNPSINMTISTSGHILLDM